MSPPWACPIPLASPHNGRQHPHRSLQRPGSGQAARREPRRNRWCDPRTDRRQRGFITPEPGFLKASELTKENGALLVFDEVMTGFRISYGGAQAKFGVTPDPTTMGKVIGGGLPVGATAAAPTS